ncbi:translation initiation factor IF-2-like [Nycticebus coucang]|uniref:translation initiation factor IF-2-like n=1 Tax=Nycticebus coucang TaxID=9470 RepID=UPI00234D0029|nr:translation initiation factor IF-2-like [Nycticebus coucang]
MRMFQDPGMGGKKPWGATSLHPGGEEAGRSRSAGAGPPARAGFLEQAASRRERERASERASKGARSAGRSVAKTPNNAVEMRRAPPPGAGSYLPPRCPPEGRCPRLRVAARTGAGRMLPKPGAPGAGAGGRGARIHPGSRRGRRPDPWRPQPHAPAGDGQPARPEPVLLGVGAK